MPELPEVETIRRGLESQVVGRRIERLYINNPHLRTPLVKKTLKRQLQKHRIVGLGRRAKYLLFYLQPSRILALHLGMSGRLLLANHGELLLPHTHVRLEFDDGRELRFVDPRRFGMFFTLLEKALASHPRFADLGPEPLGEDFHAEYLQSRGLRTRRPIKNFLMDAKVVSGIGNIYASEALYRAGIHPNTRAQRIRPTRWQRIVDAVVATLTAAIKAGGTTINDFRTSTGEMGYFQVELNVYDKAGEDCKKCSRTIRRIVQAGRSTFYCPGCQH